MATVEKISVAVTQEMAGTLKRVVDTGEYASVSEVVREALREWDRRRADRARALEELDRLIDEGLGSGPPVDGDVVLARLLKRVNDRMGLSE